MEVEAEPGDSGIVRTARSGHIVATATESLGAALERLQPMAHLIVTKLHRMAEGPDDISVEFGMKMTIETGLIIAHTSGEANFKVSLHWSRQ